MSRKPSRGRQKIPMEKMKNESSLLVTFSKRRSGIMKKSNEISTLTGADMAVIIFSPGNRVFSFGKPSLDTILNRFQNLQIPNNPQPAAEDTNSLTERLLQLSQEEKLKKLNEKCDRLKEEYETERKIKQLMDQIIEIEENDGNFEASIENLNLENLEKLKASFQELNKNAFIKAAKNVENQGEPSFRFQNDFGTNAVSGDGFGLSSQVYASGPSTFGGGGGFYFDQGEASGSIKNGVPVAPLGFSSYAGSSTFGGGSGYHFGGGGGASSSISNGFQMNVPPQSAAAPPAVGSSRVSYYAPNIQDDGFYPNYSKQF